MRADRVYATTRPVPECRIEVATGRGIQFDSVLAHTFLRLELVSLVGDLVADRTPERV